ncbi:MAG TPA: SHOCT domain-containing protein [Ilumatobacteraceae bacterium]|nr:SHOCT domain-containing protein [Ilumatobacteraceae bacterium]
MGLIKTAAKVAVASSVHGRVQRRQQQRWAEQDLQAAPAAASAALPTSGTPDLETQLALIAQLNELRQAGALTDAEFDAKKAQILGL